MKKVTVSFWSKQDPFILQGLEDSVEDSEVVAEAKADFFSCLRSLTSLKVVGAASAPYIFLCSPCHFYVWEVFFV